MAKKVVQVEERRALLVWDKSRFQTEIEQRIVVGKDLLARDVPSQSVYGYGYTVKKQYDENAFETFKQAKKKWENVTKEILQQAFDIPKNNYFEEFSKAGYIAIVTGREDWVIEYKKEVSQKIAALESLIEQLPYIPCAQIEMASVPASKAKAKKIFVSHSSKDADFAKALVKLLLLMGFQPNEVFCSSVQGCWVDNGGDFFKVIRKHFDEYELFVIFIHSPRFYESHVSLNEMGAAWVLQSEYCSFLTADMSFKQIDAVVPSSEVAVKVNGDEPKSRMNDWKNRILSWFKKKEMVESLWEMYRDDFLEKANQIVYPSNTSQSTSKPIVHNVLSDEDEKRLKEWVDSNDNELYQVWYTGGSAVFGLGAMNQYEVKSGKEMAEWQSFFKRLLAIGLIEAVGYTSNGNHPEYQLTEKAYKYFEQQ